MSSGDGSRVSDLSSVVRPAITLKEATDFIRRAGFEPSQVKELAIVAGGIRVELLRYGPRGDLVLVQGTEGVDPVSAWVEIPHAKEIPTE